MSSLTNIDKMKLEKLLGMSSGYVLDFSNASFQSFAFDAVRRDIYDEKYDHGSGSKANRLRAFWSIEPDFVVGCLLDGLLEHLRTANMLAERELTSGEQALFEECKAIAARLKAGAADDALDELTETDDALGFDMLVESIRDSIEKGQPQAALDRLHTYTVKFVRGVCTRRGIEWDREATLNGLFARYVKMLTANNELESEMATRILKSSISLFDAFNHVRNDRSFAHDNPVLNYEESILIFRVVVATICFVRTLESVGAQKDQYAHDEPWDEVPF